MEIHFNAKYILQVFDQSVKFQTISVFLTFFRSLPQLVTSAFAL